MPICYSAKVPTLEPSPLDTPMHLAIGRLIRSCAEIEDLVTLYICRLFGLTEAKAFILLGPMALTKRLQLAQRGATASGDSELAIYSAWFDDDAFKMIVAARNAVAHGVVLGKSPAGAYAFRTLRQVGLEEGQFSTEVMLYDAATLEEHAAVAAKGLAKMAGLLKLEALLQTRREQPLGPHPKAQPPKKRDGGLSSPPQS